MKKVVLVRYGEIHLKGRNRPFFERRLLENIKSTLGEFEGISVSKAQGRFYIENIENEGRITELLTKVFGIISVSPAWKVDKDLGAIKLAAEEVVRAALDKRNKEQITFKVESKRADKKFPLNSMELSRTVGAHLLKRFDGKLKVDVHSPEVTVNVEVREFAYVYSEIISGAGGMPVGTNGKGVLLISGGIDSPVAGWMVAKRGVELSCVHFHSFPYTSDRSKEKVIELCRILTRYCGTITLYVVPFTRIQQELYTKCPDSQLTILMRRFMMRIAEIIAQKEQAKVLITGESIGQVASQTIDSLVVTSDAVTMPIIRPLIGFDKIEIIELAKKIGTYETSILPYEDCCSVFVPRHPVTHPKVEKIRESEKQLAGEELIEEAVDSVEIIQIKPGRGGKDA